VRAHVLVAAFLFLPTTCATGASSQSGDRILGSHPIIAKGGSLFSSSVIGSVTAKCCSQTYFTKPTFGGVKYVPISYGAIKNYCAFPLEKRVSIFFPESPWWSINRKIYSNWTTDITGIPCRIKHKYSGIINVNNFVGRIYACADSRAPTAIMPLKQESYAVSGECVGLVLLGFLAVMYAIGKCLGLLDDQSDYNKRAHRDRDPKDPPL
jgi:hypothetical protein